MHMRPEDTTGAHEKKAKAALSVPVERITAKFPLCGNFGQGMAEFCPWQNSAAIRKADCVLAALVFVRLFRARAHAPVPLTSDDRFYRFGILIWTKHWQPVQNGFNKPLFRKRKPTLIILVELKSIYCRNLSSPGCLAGTPTKKVSRPGPPAFLCTCLDNQRRRLKLPLRHLIRKRVHPRRSAAGRVILPEH
jgi:hypothetical protein